MATILDVRRLEIDERIANIEDKLAELNREIDLLRAEKRDLVGYVPATDAFDDTKLEIPPLDTKNDARSATGLLSYRRLILMIAIVVVLAIFFKHVHWIEE